MAVFQLKTKQGTVIKLDDNNEIHRGGEGRIILLDSNKEQVAKIYHQGIHPLTEKRFEQLQKLDKRVFIRPIDLLFHNGGIIGHLMEYAGTEYFPIAALFNRSFCQRNSITDKFKNELTKKLIEAVKQAHFNGFVIGDLNQYNVLVNLSGEIRLIDVDSYETPGNKHTGMLLDDIRDYYYNGIVSMNSDYFALSVLLFYLFTYTHPFKGTHQKYKTLAERMVHQVPVFLKDPLLTLPKCYEPIVNSAIQQKFEKIYLDGERFLFSMDGYSIKIPSKKPVIVAQHQENDLIINIVTQNWDIKDVYFNLNIGFIETADKFIIYSSKNRSYLDKKLEIRKIDFEKVFLGNENIILFNNRTFYLVKDNGNIVELTNFRYPEKAFHFQFENILLIVAEGQMYWLYLDEVLNTSIKNKRIEAFCEAFSHHNGLIQNTGGVHRVFYHTTKDLAIVKVPPKKLRQLFQRGNVGVFQYIDNDKLVNQYFKIKGLNFELIDVKPDSMVEFGYMNENDEGFIFEPDDNKLLIRRTIDFKVISEIKCSKISRQSSLFYSNAGIIVWERNDVYLVNRK